MGMYVRQLVIEAPFRIQNNFGLPRRSEGPSECDEFASLNVWVDNMNDPYPSYRVFSLRICLAKVHQDSSGPSSNCIPTRVTVKVGNHIFPFSLPLRKNKDWPDLAYQMIYVLVFLKGFRSV